MQKDVVSNYPFNLRNYSFSCYATLTLPKFGYFGYSWDYQTVFLFLDECFLVLCKIKPWCISKCHGIILAFSRYHNARCANATSSPNADTAASITSAETTAAPATAPAATPLLIESQNHRIIKVAKDL